MRGHNYKVTKYSSPLTFFFAICTPNIMLEAVNGTRISTFGKRQRPVVIGGKTYMQEVILADVRNPIIGWNFIKNHKISLIWSDTTETMELVDRVAKVKSALRLGPPQKGTFQEC